jgi:hypothetical protein
MANQPNPGSDPETERTIVERSPTRSETAANWTHPRRSPIDHSESGLVSRDYQPRHDGPELVASWPLGPSPAQTELGNVDWEITTEEPVQLQRNLTVNHFLGSIDYTTFYVGVRGSGRIDASGETLTLTLSTTHLEGDEYETAIELTNTTDEPFITPLIEFTPDARVYGEHEFIGSEMYGGYVLSAAVSGGTGYLDQGTSVHLWSE